MLLQSTTFDDWATPMYALMRSSSPHVWIYFVLIVILGGWFVGACVARAPSRPIPRPTCCYPFHLSTCF